MILGVQKIRISIKQVAFFYHYEQITLKGYTGRATFTFSKSHRLEEATVHIPVTSKVEQKVVLNNLSQTIKKELEELPDYQSMTTDTVGLYDDGYRYKVKLKGQQWELWVDVYPTENKYATDTETDKYTIRVDQFLMYPMMLPLQHFLLAIGSNPKLFFSSLNML